MLSGNLILFLKGTLLQIAGLIVITISLVGFIVVTTTDRYSITHVDKSSAGNNYTYTTGTLESVQEKNPAAIVKKLDKGFPFKSAFFFVLGLYLIAKKRKSSKDFNTLERLQHALNNNEKVDISKLSKRLNMDEQKIIDRLFELNSHFGTSYSFNHNSNLIVDTAATLEWNASSTCDNCGAVSLQNVVVSIEKESLTCPYCDSKVNDAEFESYRKERLEKKQSDGSRWRFLSKYFRKSRHA